MKLHGYQNNIYVKKFHTLANRSLYFPPLVVSAAILIITIWPWQNARQATRENFDQSVSETINNTENAITERFGVYHTTLQSGAALVLAQPDVTNVQWNTFFNYKNTTANQNGMRSIGFVKTFTAAEYPQVRSLMTAQGFDSFQVFPQTLDSTLNSAILYQYAVVSDEGSAVGFNMLSELNRRNTLLTARDEGAARMTEVVALVQNSQSSSGKELLLVVPVYKNGMDNATIDQRRSNLTGFVYGAFRVNELFDRMLSGLSKRQGFGVSIYTTTAGQKQTLFRTTIVQSLTNNSDVHKVVRQMKLYGSIWQVEYVFDKGSVLSKSELNASIYILIVGVTTAFLVFVALLSIFKSRARELRLQKEYEVNLAKDELLSLASHQMRTPATGVKQYIGMVLQGFAGEVDDSQREILEKAYTSNERQLHVVNQILHLAKLDSGRIVLAKQQVDISDLVKDVVDEQRAEYESRGHSVKLQIPKKPAIVKVDVHMIRMTIENILSNAIKYTVKPGKIWVIVSQTKTDVTITIKDTGVGIDEKLIPTIFEQFTRLYDEKTEQVSGTGVGLYLADQLVRLHKGALTVKSVVGKGSTFFITLPKKKFNRK